MTDIVWQDPPERVKGHGSGGRGRPPMYAELAAELKANPGRWALLRGDLKPGAASTLRARINGRTSYRNLHGCEAITRGTEVYVRWPEETS